MKLELGDYIEVEYKDFIRQNIPSYETIWGQFIGHDGKGQMIKVKTLTDKEQQDRTDFAEYLYTCLESFVCMNSVCQAKIEVDLKYPREYLDMLNMFMAFQAHAGRIYDNTNRLLAIYLDKKKVSELMTRLNDTYQKRNNVLHGKKLPYRIEDSLVLIAPLKGADESSKDWHSGMNWAQFKSDDLVFMTDYLKSTLEEICATFNGIISNLLEPVQTIIKAHDIKVERENYSQNEPFYSSGTNSGYSKSYPYNMGKSGSTANY